MIRVSSRYPTSYTLTLCSALAAIAMLAGPTASADYLPAGVKVYYVHPPVHAGKIGSHVTYNGADIDDTKQLARLGDADAQNDLGVMLASRGQYKEAANWYKRAADVGVARAAYNLGMLYVAGLGVPQDAQQARHWLEEGAKRNDPYAQFQLGRMAADAATEKQWYEEAGRQGLPAAQYNLAVMYHNGEGTDGDDVKAYAWLLAAQRNGMEIREAKSVIAAGLTPGQMRSAEDLSRSLPLWQASRTALSPSVSLQADAVPTRARAAF